MQDCPLLRPAEAAVALGLSLARLRRFAADGRLVTVRTLGGHRRYRQDDVLAVQRWMELHQNSGHDGGGHGGVPPCTAGGRPQPVHPLSGPGRRRS